MLPFLRQPSEALGPNLDRLARIARLLCDDVATADDLLAEAISRSLVPWRRGGVADPATYVRRVMVNLLAWRSRRLALSRRRDHQALDWLPGGDLGPSRPPAAVDRSVCNCCSPRVG